MAIIYKTTCLVNNKIYIVQSKYNKNSYLGSGKIFKKAIKKYGINNFKKEILIDGNFSQGEIDQLEINFIKEFNSTNKYIGYNISPGGNGNTERTNTLIGISKTGKKLSEDIKNKISNSKKGKKASFETKEKLSKVKIGNKNRVGKKHSEKDRENISSGIKKYFQLNENRIKSSNVAKKRIRDGKCLNGVKIISSKENQEKATKLARLKNIKGIKIVNILTNEEIICESLVRCREFFNIKSNNSIINCIKNNKTYRKIFILTYKN